MIRLRVGPVTECSDCVDDVMLFKVLREASVAYESGLQQRSTAAAPTACAGAVAAVYSDAWEKFSLEGDRSADTQLPGVDSIKESSQV